MSLPESDSKRSRKFVEQLRSSQIYRDYEQAFRETTGLPIALQPVDGWNLPFRDDPKQNPFCALMAGSNQSCSACLQQQSQLQSKAQVDPATTKCFAGLCDSAVPIRVGENVVAFLQTGQILLHQPDSKQFSKVTRQLLGYGVEADLKRLEEKYFLSRVLTGKQHESIVRLLSIFAQHLAALSNQLAVQEEHSESPQITKARSFIQEHQDEDLSLEQVARAVNMSAFYFCKMFKKATGMTFTDYLARVRVEKVKNLLLNPHKRISEAAFEAGFQSLSQFNRVFRRVAGESPTTYRDRIHSEA
jgi:AraC-like DNA-binding protein/ligand-binding sensor protein